MLRDEQTRALKLAGAFLTLGALWILVSDAIVEHRALMPPGPPTAQTWKGWLFVFLAAVFVYVVVERELRRRRKAEGLAAFRAGLLDEVGQAVIATDLDGYIRFWNPAAERLFGWPEAEVLGSDMLTITGAPSSRAEDAVIDELRRSGEWREEFLLQRRDGSTFPGLVSNAALHDAAGHVTGFVSVTTDISERVRLEEELQQAQKLEAIGRLAGGVAHDFNNILTVISGHAELLVSEVTADAGLRTSAAEIQSAAARAAELTRQLLAFSRKQVLRPAVLNLNDVIVQSKSMLGRLVGEQFELVLQLHPEPCHVRADRMQLEQVLMNLVVNARDAMPDGGPITISTARVQGAPAADTPMDGADVRYVRLDVADDGTGIEPKVLLHIFEPFYTTKEPGRGTGLGLSMVYGIVQQSGGYLQVESRHRAGTTMKVFLPHVEPEMQPEPVAPRPAGAAPTAPAPSGGEIVLVVEDDPAVRGLVVQILSRRGYEVLQASEPPEALRLLERQVPFDLVVTDVIMPGMSGVELAGRLREARPELAVLCISGYTAASMPSSALDDAAPRLLEKPFSAIQLLAAVRAALDEKGSRSVSLP